MFTYVKRGFIDKYATPKGKHKKKICIHEGNLIGYVRSDKSGDSCRGEHTRKAVSEILQYN